MIMAEDDLPVRWTCFFCSETFADRRAAFLHFGGDEGCSPACQIKASEGGLIEALRAAEEFAAEGWAIVHEEGAEGLKAWRAAQSRHAMALTSAEQTGYERGLADRGCEIERLRRIVVHYGDRLRMANCHRSDWQIEIDEAFRFVADNSEGTIPVGR